MRTIVWMLVWIAAIGLAPVAYAQEGPGLREAELSRALAQYRHEPTVARVLALTLRERSASPGRIRDALDRARASGVMPIARASVRRGQTVDLRGLGVGAVDEITNVSTDDALTFEASVFFRLDRLVFAPEERSLLAELRATEQERERVVMTVVGVYYERRRLQLERDLTGMLDVVRALRLLELEGLLDAFTAGAFTRMLARAR